MLLKGEIERPENRYLPIRSVKRQNRTRSSSALLLLLLGNPRKAMYDLESVYLELRDRAVERRNREAGKQILAKPFSEQTKLNP